MSNNKKDPKLKHKRFCGHCRNHGFKFEIRGHKGNCKYRFCVCEKCTIQEYANMLSVDERKCQKVQEQSKNVESKNVGHSERVLNGNCEKSESISNVCQSSSSLEGTMDRKGQNVYEFHEFGERLPPFQSLKKSATSENEGIDEKVEELPDFCENFGKF
jgi:hypothetical protein